MKKKRQMYDMRASSMPGADGRSRWIRATVFLPPEYATVFNERIARALREQMMPRFSRPTSEDVITRVVNQFFVDGLREVQQRYK